MNQKEKSFEMLFLESLNEKLSAATVFLKEESEKLEDEVNKRKERVSILWEEFNNIHSLWKDYDSETKKRKSNESKKLLDEIHKLENNLEIKSNRLEEVKSLLKEVEKNSSSKDRLAKYLTFEKVIELEKEISKKAVVRKVSDKKQGKLVIRKTRKIVKAKINKKSDEEISNSSYTNDQVKLFDEAEKLLGELSRKNIDEVLPKILNIIDKLKVNKYKKLLNNELEDKKKKIEEEKIKDEFEEIYYYLDLLKNNKNLNTINFITDLIVKLKDGEEKDNLMADLSYTYNQVKLYNEAKDLLNKLSKENIDGNLPEISSLIAKLEDSKEKKLLNNVLEDKKNKIEEEKIKDEFEEIYYYLDLLKNNKNLNTINFITDLIVKLKDGEEKDNLMADLSYTYNQVKLYNEAKDLLNKLSKENIEEVSPKILDLINKLDDNNDKKLIKKELEDKKSKIEEEKTNDEENLTLATTALDMAIKKMERKYLDSAKEYIKKIKDKKIKENLEEKLIFAEKKINFVEKLNLAKPYDVKITNQGLSILLGLYKDIFPRLTDEEKNYFSKEVNEIIALNNVKNMKEENRNAVEDEADVKSVKELFVEFCGKAVSWVYNSKFGKKFFKKRLEKAFDEGKNDKVEKIQKILSERDIVSGVRLYRNLNKFNKLKYKVYKEGPESLTKKEDSKYSKLCGKISYQMYKGLEKKISDEELTDDKQRTIMILNQYFEALALGINLEEITTKITKILDEASNKGTLTEAEYKAYFNEVKNMKKYFAKYNNDIINYNPENIENAVRYYDSEKIYGLDFAKGISYIRR